MPLHNDRGIAVRQYRSSALESPCDRGLAVFLLLEDGSIEVRQAISVVKERGSSHELTLREFTLSSGQSKIGNPLREFRGVLTGVPVMEGSTEGSKGLQA